MRPRPRQEIDRVARAKAVRAFRTRAAHVRGCAHVRPIILANPTPLDGCLLKLRQFASRDLRKPSPSFIFATVDLFCMHLTAETTHRYRPWLESASEPPIAFDPTDARHCNSMRARSRFLLTLHGNMVADNRREMSWTNGT